MGFLLYCISNLFGHHSQRNFKYYYGSGALAVLVVFNLMFLLTIIGYYNLVVYLFETKIGLILAAIIYAVLLIYYMGFKKLKVIALKYKSSNKVHSYIAMGYIIITFLLLAFSIAIKN